MRTKRSLILIFTTLSLLSGCQPTAETLKTLSSKIFSNRPQKKDHFIGIIKLKNPALFSSTEVENGKSVIDEDLKNAILAEQEQMEQKLGQISPEIKIISRYRFVLNALAIVAPAKLESQLRALGGISYIEKEGAFARPQTLITKSSLLGSQDLTQNNSMTFIGAHKAYKQGILGEGVKVGIIDTGIDYTHAMLGGSGDPELFKNLDPATENEFFPNAKVVGGIDLVGTKYDASSPLFEQHVPLPDKNPIDEGGHGSHVAGTVAGLGNGTDTYDGVAPKAMLHAIKVFGAEGSTGDTVIIAALEYAADPNGDLSSDDQLDVVNLSLGSGYGKPHILYSEAIKNLVKGGTITVASAGNSGHHSYIVGAPSTVTEAISVAASIDGMDHNFKFDAVKFETQTRGDLFSQLSEATFSKPISDFSELKGKLVYIGTAADDLTDEQKNALKGHVAFIDRGAVTFSSKAKRAFEAGAIAAIIANNVDGAAFRMGGDDKVEIPTIMITKAIGDILKEEMKSADVFIDFKTNQKIEKPELIDTLTDFSSRGPRSQDSLIKPEISAPGANVISAKMGGGKEGVPMSGTSMSGPHIAGVMALLKQWRSDLAPLELKSVLLGSAKTIANKDKEIYPVSQQGAGRVQVDKSLSTKVIAWPSTLSLGEIVISEQKAVRKNITLKNITDKEQTFSFMAKTDKQLRVSISGPLTLAPGESREVSVMFFLSTEEMKDAIAEVDGFLFVMQEEQEILRLPILAILSKLSQVSASKLEIYSSAHDSAQSAVDLTLINTGKNDGEALLFNLIAQDQRKIGFNGDINANRSRLCDLQSAGYRVIEREDKAILQIGVKLYNPLTSWQPCEIAVLIDTDGDEIAEQELVGIIHDNLPGLDGQDFNSLLLDAKKTRELRKLYELTYAQNPDGDKPKEDYKEAILSVSPMTFYNHSTISVIEADLSAVAKRPNGELAIRLAVLDEDRGTVEADDFLDDQFKKWKTINLNQTGMGYVDFPEKVMVKAGQRTVVPLKKGEASDSLVVYYPQNRVTGSYVSEDLQSEIPKEVFVY